MHREHRTSFEGSADGIDLELESQNWASKDSGHAQKTQIGLSK
jgi:hypothetical protein